MEVLSKEARDKTITRGNKLSRHPFATGDNGEPLTMSVDYIMVKEHPPNREEIQRIGEQMIENMMRQFKDTTHIDSPPTPKTQCPARMTSSCQTDEPW